MKKSKVGKRRKELAKEKEKKTKHSMLITLTTDEVTDSDDDELEEGLGDALSKFLLGLFD